MIQFAKKLFIFLILVKLIDASLYFFFTRAHQTLISLDDDYGSLNRMYQGLINADIVFAGSSRIYLHINPEIIQDHTGYTAWNIGMDGSNFEQHKFTIEEYLLHNKQPKIIVLEASLESLDTSALAFKTFLFLPFRNRSWHTLELFNKDWEDTVSYWLLSSSIYKNQLTKIVRAAKNISNIPSAPQTNTDIPTLLKLDGNDCLFINGACLKQGQALADLPDTLPARSNQYDFSGIEQRKQGFEELAKLAEKKGFILVLLTPPYLNGTVSEAEWKIASDFYTGLAQKYENTRYFDYSSNKVFSDDISLWWNSGHLNVVGANLLSEDLGNVLYQALFMVK